jgi:hypothetical protein
MNGDSENTLFWFSGHLLGKRTRLNSRLRGWLLGVGSIASLCILSACGNLGPMGGNRSQFTAGTITSLSPSTIMAGGPPFTLTVNGSNFSPGNTDVLLWNGVQQIPAVGAGMSAGSTTQATYVIDASLIESPGNISIVLTVPNTVDRPSNTLTLTVAPRATTACALFGLYDFQFTGFGANFQGFGKNSGAVMAVGAFGVDANGNLSGEEDIIDYPGFQAPAGGLATALIAGTCANSAIPNQGILTFKLLNSPAFTDTLTYTFVLQQAGSGAPRGRLVELGDLTSSFGTLSGSGDFVGAAPDSVLSGDYAFGLVGTDPAGDGSQIGVAGRFTYSNGNLSAGVADINDGGAVTANTPFSGNTTAPPPDLYSRVFVGFTLGGQKAALIIYANSLGRAFAIGAISSQTGTKGLAGFISSQANAGAYSNGSLNAPLVFSTWGAPAPLYTGSSYATSSDTTLGLISGVNGGTGSFNLQFDQVAGGVANLNQSATAAYSVASNGRATVSYSLGGNPVDYVYYLDDSNDGFILGESSNTAEFGFFQSQAPGPFNNATINGSFVTGTFLPMTPTSPNLATEITLNNGTLSASTPAGALSGTYTVASSGRGTASVNLPVLGGSNVVLYVIGPGSVEVMGSDNTMSDAITFMHF